MTFDATYADYVPNSMPDGWGITFEPLDSDDRRNFILAPTGRGDMRGEIFRRLGVKIPTDYSTAHCAYHPDPDLWFDYRRQAQALAICEGCPMRTTCIEEAEARRERGCVAGRSFFGPNAQPSYNVTERAE